MTDGRNGKILRLLGAMLTASFGSSPAAYAEPSVPESTANGGESAVLPVPPAPAVAPEISRAEKDSGPLIKAPKPKKGKRREQKETEGTEALERFQADTILKSPYTLDGQSLEVDPD